MQNNVSQFSKFIKEYSLTQQKRIKLFKSIYIKIQIKQKISSKNVKLQIRLYSIVNNHLLFQIVRKIKQIDYLQQFLVNQYGGHVIPVLNFDIFFENNKILQTTLDKIEQYLNQVIKDYYCICNIKVYNFFFNSQQAIPQQQTYNKILSKATNYSRKYLNSIFARKQVHKFSNPFVQDYLSNYKYFKQFQQNFQTIYLVIKNNCIENDIIEDIICELSQLCNDNVEAVVPTELVKKENLIKLEKIALILINVEQSYKRWELLNQNVRELQGNVNKGLHQNIKQLCIQQDKLKKWTQSLSKQYQQIIQYGQSLLQKVTNQFMINKSNNYQISCQTNKTIKQRKQKNKLQQNQQLQYNVIHMNVSNPQNQKIVMKQVQQKDHFEDKSTNSEDNSTDQSQQINNFY